MRNRGTLLLIRMKFDGVEIVSVRASELRLRNHERQVLRFRMDDGFGLDPVYCQNNSPFSHNGDSATSAAPTGIGARSFLVVPTVNHPQDFAQEMEFLRRAGHLEKCVGLLWSQSLLIFVQFTFQELLPDLPQ